MTAARAISGVGPAAVFLAIICATGPALAAEPCKGIGTPADSMVTSVRADEVDVYPAPKRGEKFVAIKKAELLGGHVDCISKNRMLRVQAGDTIGWILSRKVKLEGGPKLSSRCIEGGSTSVGATRAIGEGCKKQ